MMASAANTTFVSILYQTVLLRTGSAGEVNAWATLLDQGKKLPAGLITAFETSAEANNFVLPVIRMFEAFFARAPDAAGLSGWTNALRSGALTLSQVAEGFTGSSEFKTFYGTLPNPVAFVTGLYEHVLQRAPDNAGLTSWVRALTSGAMSFADVALGFSQSQEFISDSTATINKWLSAANANAQAGNTPIYPATLVLSSGSGGGSYALTTGSDLILGAEGGGNTITAVLDGLLPTLQGTDIINGGIGLNNVLAISSNGDSTSADILPAGLTVSNISRVTVVTPGNVGKAADTPFDTTAIAGLANLKVNSAGPGTDYIAASLGTGVNDTNTGGGVTVTGGRNVNVTANGSIDVENAAGTIVLNDTNPGGGDTITVTGSIGVSIATAGHNVHISVGGGTPATDPLGSVTVTAGSSGEVVTISNPLANSVTLGLAGTVQIGGYTNAGSSVAFLADSVTVGASGSVAIGAIASSANGGNVIGAIDIVVGVNSTVTFGAVTAAPGSTNTLTETVDVSSNIAGATSAGGYTMTTVTGAVHGTGQQIAFSVEPHETFTTAAVDVSSAATLAAALDLAATHMGKQGGGAVPMQTGVLTWFQYGGDTYIVDANNNNTVTPIAHTGLAANDIVVKVTGLVTIDANPNFAVGHVLVI